MNKTHALRFLTMALGTMLLAPAFAQVSGQYYGGASVGKSRAKLDESGMAAYNAGPAISVTGVAVDDSATGYKVFGGYRMNSYLAIEAGLFSLGTFGFDASTLPLGSVHGESKYRGMNLDLLGTMPLTDTFSALLRVGVQRSWTRNSFSGTGAVIVPDSSPRTRGVNYKAGVGLQYAMSPHVALRAEVERYRINDAMDGKANVNAYTVGLVFPFGAAPMRQAYVAPAPAPMPVAAPPAPAPVIVVAPPPAPAPVVPPTRQRVSFAAESLFGFDTSAVRPEGQAALEQFARDANASRYDVINVEGHTDRLGSEAYNQTLSLQRAEAVKAYLVSRSGIDAGKIAAVGKGESSPVTKREDCPGNTASAKLIACLQPDRRVDLEMVGTR
ncbi:OmpA family protein [Roseateles sp.]|jgi:OOP family OmpA-OmpF porin|uniref:OmpA family protein n=1 Tax=Roseateles sp. TaxID=1971397 RepID=UPI0037C809C3